MDILHLDAHLNTDADFCKKKNICSMLSAEQLTCIAEAVNQGYEADEHSRSAWLSRNSAGMDLAMQLQKDKNFPWPGSSNVIFPLVTISALQFAARAYSNIIQGSQVVRMRTKGTAKEQIDRATRIAKHMSWQVLEEDEAWEEQHDALLINLAVVGTNFVKTFHNGEHNVSELVTARDLVVNYWAKSLETASRVTQIIKLSRNEIFARCKSKRFIDILDAPWYTSPPTAPMPQRSYAVDNRAGQTPPQSDYDTPFTFLEQHRWLDLDGDGYAEPYVVTLEQQSKTVVRILPRWDDEKQVERYDGEIVSIKPTQYYTRYIFIPSPDGGFYGMGFGQFLGPINESVNTGINQLLDNGTMQNSLGGFLGRGAKIRGGVYSMAPWEWKRVDSTGDDLRKNLVPFPERQPSTVMFQLIGLLIQYADRLAGTVDQAVGENPGQNTPAETARTSLAEGLKVYSMIFKRVWRSMKGEFSKLFILNGMYLKVSSNYGEAADEARQEDYRANPNQIRPVADPNLPSSEMRIFQAGLVKQSAQTTPGYAIPEVERNWLSALQIENMDILYPGPDKVPPLPNRWVMVEQLKMQGQQQKFKAEAQRWANELMEEKRLNAAKIAQLEAQAISLLATADAEKAAIMIKRFDSAIAAAKVYHEAINDRIEALGKVSSGAEGEGDAGNSGASDGGGMAGMEGASGDTGVSAPAPAMA